MTNHEEHFGQMARDAATLQTKAVQLHEDKGWEAALQPELQAVALYEALAQHDSDAYTPRLAASLGNMSVFLLEGGRVEEGLVAAERAVALQEVIAGRCPEDHLPDLARGLGNLAICLSSNGRIEEALIVARRAVVIHGELAQLAPEAHVPDFARSLTNFASFLSANERREEALEVARRAVEQYEELAQRSPELHLYGLATSLNNLSGSLSDSGQREEALGVSRRAVSLYEDLMKRNPEVYSTQFAHSLGNLGRSLSESGFRKEALLETQRAVAIHEELANRNPKAHLADLATSLNKLAVDLSENGQIGEAIAVARRCVSIRESLATANSDAHLSELGTSLSNLAAALADNSQLDEALHVSKRAMNIRETLVQRNPEAHMPDFAASLSNVAAALAQSGMHDEALQVSRRALALYEELHRRAPDAFLHQLAAEFTNLSRHLSMFGGRAEALQMARRGVAANQELVERQEHAFLPQLANSLDSLASRLSEDGRLEEALDVAKDAVAAHEKLARLNPDAHLPGWARSLESCAARLSDVGEDEEALQVVQKAVTAYEELAHRNRDSFLPDLARSLSNLGVALSGIGRRDAALHSGRQAVATYRDLVQRNPGAYMSGLASSLLNLTLLLKEDGQAEQARTMAAQAAECQAHPSCVASGQWAEHVMLLSESFGTLGDLAFDGFHERFLRLFDQRLDLTTRDAFVHELDAFRWFCVTGLRVVVAAAGTQVSLTTSFLLRIVSALQSRDVLSLFLAELERADAEHQDLATLRSKIVQKCFARAARQEEVGRITSDAKPSARTSDVIGALDSEITGLRTQYRLILIRLAQGDAVSRTALGEPVTLETLRHALRTVAPNLVTMTAPRPQLAAPEAAQPWWRRVVKRVTQNNVAPQVRGHAAWLFLLELPLDGDQMQFVAVWLSDADVGPRLVELPDLWELAREHEQMRGQVQTLNLYARALRKGAMGEPEVTPELQNEQAQRQEPVKPFIARLGRALLGPLREAGIELEGLHSLVLCSHGAAHTLPFAMLREFKQTADGASAIRLLHYPGLPHALAAAERLKSVASPEASVSAGAWVLAGDAALGSAVPLPMTLVERELVRGLLDVSQVQLLHTGDEVRQRFAQGQEPAAGFMALCHAQHLNVHDSQLQLGGEPVKALEVMGWKQVPRVALLPVCLVGRARDDERGNAMGLVSALMIKGCEVVVGYTHPVAGALSPWLTTLLVWHMGRGLDAWSAAHLARDQFARQDWPGEYQAQMRQAIASVLPKLLWDSRPPGELALEVQLRNEFASRKQLRDALLTLAKNWPWQDKDAFRGLLTEHDELMLPARAKAICDGLFIPREGIKDALALAMAEQAGCLQVFGRPEALSQPDDVHVF